MEWLLHFWNYLAPRLGWTVPTALAGLVILKHLECHTPGCHHWGRFHLDGTPFKLCHKCHPQALLLTKKGYHVSPDQTEAQIPDGVS